LSRYSNTGQAGHENRVSGISRLNNPPGLHRLAQTGFFLFGEDGFEGHLEGTLPVESEIFAGESLSQPVRAQVKAGVDNHDAHRSIILLIFFFAAIVAFYFNPNKTPATCWSSNPGMVCPGRIVTHVALVAAGQLGDPIPLLIPMKADN